MSEDATCAACGTEGTLGRAVRFLSTPGGSDEPDEALHLCEGCLSKRSAKTWHSDGSQGAQIKEELDGPTSGPRDRYSYLEEPGQRIHLMRLRPDWVDAHRGS